MASSWQRADDCLHRWRGARHGAHLRRPRELVWKVITDPERVTNWWGPHGHTTTVEEMDVRAGRPLALDQPHAGRRATRRSRASTSRSSRRSVSSTPRSSTSRRFNDGERAINTLTLEDLGGRTKVVARSRFPSVETSRAHSRPGMIGGALETYDRLADGNRQA